MPGLFIGNRALPMLTLPYGKDAEQTFDVYRAQKPNGKVIFMVHGGGWRRGDKAADGVITNKLACWGGQGYTIVSTDYRVLPSAKPDVQVADVATSLAYAQKHARDWGCDPDKFIIMGHSAGAHLTALLNADPSIARKAGCRDWLCSVELDSAAYDVENIMNGPFGNQALYHDAFGDDPAYWAKMSPVAQAKTAMKPMMLVYSLQRGPMDENGVLAFEAAAEKVETKIVVYPVDLSHGEIDSQLGLPSDYTTAVNNFIRKYSR